MANVTDPKKVFNFSIATPGLNNFEAQEVTIPDFEIAVVEHGDTNYDAKTGGKIKFGNITIHKIASATSIDTWVHAWIRQVQDAFLGGGQLPQQYQKFLTITQYGPDFVTPTDQYECYAVWPCKVNGIELKRTSSDNVIQTIELSTDRVLKVL